MNTTRALLAGAALCAFAAPAAAGTVLVPQDQPTIQAGVDAAQSGDTVLISAGTYSENVTLTGRSGLILQAKGKVVIDIQDAQPAFALDTCDHIDFVGLRITDGSGHGIQLTDCSFVTFTACRFEQLLGDGVHATGSDSVSCTKCSGKIVTGAAFAFAPAGADTPCNDVLVQKCHTLHCNTGVIAHGNAPQLLSNRIVFAGVSAISLVSVTAGVVGKNKLTKLFGGVGVRTKDTNGQTEITDNVISGNGVAFDLDTTQQTNLRRNKVRIVEGAVGVLFNSCTDCLAEQNKIKTGNAVVAQGCDGVDFTANVIKGDKTGNGIALTFTSNCTLQDNTFSKSTSAISINGDNDVVIGGVLAKPQIGVSIGTGTTGASVSGLTIKGCSSAAIFMDGTGTNVSGCKIVHPKGDGVRVFGHNGTLTGNTVTKAGANGVHLEAGSTGNTLSANVATKSKNFDLLDESGGANTVQPDNQFGTTSP